MIKFKKIALFLCVSLTLSACANNVGNKENTEINKEQKKDYKKFSRAFFGVFDTEIAFSAYCENEEEFNKYFIFLESEMKRYHNLYNSFANADENNIKTINDNAGIKAVKVDKEIIELLEFSIDNYNNISDKNNIAVGSVTSLWRAEKETAVDLQGKLPDTEKIKEALTSVDINSIVIDKKESTVYVKNKNTMLDVGAIAKGYSVEKIMNKLKEMGLENAIISAGGNVKALGKPQEKEKNKWGIGIQTPAYDGNVNDIKDVIYSGEISAVTSGDYQRFYYVDGKAYNHIIDPKTGYPQNKVKSVTVLYKDSGVADFLSTSLFLNDVENGKAILKKVQGAEAFWILEDGSVEYTEEIGKMLKSKGATNK